MTDDELEGQLRAHYRTIDPVRAPGDLGRRIEDTMDRRVSRPVFIVRARPAFGAAIAAVLVIAVGLGLRPGGFLSPAGPSPSPTLSSQPSPSSAGPSPSPSAPPPADSVVDEAGTFAGGGVWAVHGDTLLVSTDAGATWRRSSIPASGVIPGSGVIAPTFVLDPDHAWSVTYGPGSTEQSGSATDVLDLVVHRTVDGGQTWHQSDVPGNYAGAIPSIVFVDAQHGFLLCSATRQSFGVSTALRTDDGGATWSVAGKGDWLGSMFTASDASTLWSGAEQEAGPVAHPLLDVSRDGGARWQDARLPGLEGRTGGADLWLAGPPVFSDPANGFVAVVSSNPDGNPATKIYRTVDGGRSWSIVADQPVEASAEVAPLGAEHWLLPVDNPIGLLVTADGGKTWQHRTLSMLTIDQWMTWIGAVDGSHAAALVPTEHSSLGPLALFLSADAGQTWQPADLGASTGPTPSSTATPSSGPTTPPSPASSTPSSPVSGAAWTGIRLQAVDGGPVGVSTVAAWAGGYIALGQPSDRNPLAAWTTSDGRTWTALPSGTFGVASSALAAPIPGGVMVAVEDATGQVTIHRSADGMTWTSNPGPTLCSVNTCPSVRTLALSLPDTLAGNEAGVAAITSPDGVAFSGDGITWQSVPLPGPAAAQVQGVASFGTGFVAVGVDGTTQRSPVAWWSSDGLNWTRATVEAHPGDGFTAVYAAEGGLVALSSTGGVPGLTSFWTSPDGHSWKLSSANPMGVVQAGEGVGSANGVFSGDGTRLLGYDPGATGSSADYWTSLDGTDWTKLAVTGDTTVASIFDLSPFLMRDGILFSGATGPWFGAAVP
jgi:hypothetical protein